MREPPPINQTGMAGSVGHLDADLDALSGSWVDDPDFDEAIQAQDQVDPALWR